ncbi:hypothetical protein Tco_0151327 [Tanacetum coccineum]
MIFSQHVLSYESSSSFDEFLEISYGHGVFFIFTIEVELLSSLEYLSSSFQAIDLLVPVAFDTEAYTKNLTNLTELLTLVKNFDFPGLKTTIDSLKADVTTQNDHLAKWAESSASMAWSVGPRMTRIENTQGNIKSDLASLKL